MRHHKINELNNFIAGFYLDDDQLIDDMLTYFDNLQEDQKWEGKTAGGVNKDKKNSIDSMLQGEVYTRYQKALKECRVEYGKLYEVSECGAPEQLLEPVGIQRYYPPDGGYHIWHSERVTGSLPHALRHLVFMTYLNDIDDPDDEYAGGTEFYHQKLKVKPEKGLTLIWGADWTFTHRGIPAPKHEKTIVTGWISYDPTHNPSNN